MKNPDLRVLDTAIQYVKEGRDWYSCFALESAVEYIYPKKSLAAQKRCYTQYQNQYRLVTRDYMGRGSYPEWWDTPPGYWTWNQQRRVRASRVAALKRFRKACIDAAKKE